MELAVHTTTGPDNIVTVRLDVPGKPVNTCTPQLLAELAGIVDSLEKDNPAGVIFASAKPRSFNAGADLREIQAMTGEQIVEYLADGQALFDRIARLGMPTVAAINGDCLGGGMELALACTYRVAVDDGSISIGLPEVKLGLIPAWGGTTRLPRLIGLTRAMPILLAGKTMPPRKARRSGLVDEVVRPEVLLDAAKRLVVTHPPGQRPRMFDEAVARISVVRNRILEAARRQTLKRTYGNYDAPLELLDVIKTGYTHGIPIGLQAERAAILKLTHSDTCRNLLRLFFLRQGAKRRAADQLGAKPVPIEHAAVIGGGTMGAGIVHALIRAGIQVRLVEVDPQAVSAALVRIRKHLDDDVSAGRLSKLEARHAFNRVSPTTEWTGLALADLVIEAVIEKMEAKREVFTRLDSLTRESAVLATNTSSLRVTEGAAQATSNHRRVIGLHFFNPVDKMPLVEVVRTPESEDAALAAAVALVTRLGKTPILVKDSPGFLVNRILIPYLNEALAVASEGTPIPVIDRAMKRWGMPMGPFELLDEIGLDIAASVLKSLSGGQEPAVPPALEHALKEKWLGKKSRKGFYLYGPKRRWARPRLNEDLSRLIWSSSAPPPADALSEEPMQWRLVLPMINEAVRTLADGVTDSTDDIDLATVLGLGLAPFRGGFIKFADSVGNSEIVRRLDELTASHGGRFQPAPLLRELAEDRRPLATSSAADHPTTAAPPAAVLQPS